MRDVLKTLRFLTVFLLLSWSAPAYADGFISPWLGANFAQEIGDGRTAFGFTAGAMGGGIFGGEFDFGYSPSFFGTDNVFGDNNVMTVMGNLILGIPFGGQSGGGVRPYGSGGLGLVRTSVEGLEDITDVSDNSFGWNLGGGIMGYFGDHFGIRGDLRFFRTIGLDDLLKAQFGRDDVNEIDFWRASFGVVFR